MKSALSFFLVLLTPAGAIQAVQAQTPAPSPSSSTILATAPRPGGADASPRSALPEAPLPERVTGAGEVLVISPALALPEAPHHRFFDKTNLMLQLGVMAGETGDLITTRSILQAGGSEANPIAKPLMRAGLGGQMLATYGLGEGTTLLSAYVLHRTGHHRLERFAPITAIVVESLATGANIRTRSGMRVRH